MIKKIWVYIDHFKGSPVTAAWEALGVAHKLAAELDGNVTALIFGHNVGGLAQMALDHGAGSVKVCDDLTLEDYRNEPYARLLAKTAFEGRPEVILGPGTLRVRDIFGSASVDLETGVIVDAIALEVKDQAIHVTRPVYAGKLLSSVVCRERRPQMITVRPRAFAAPEPVTGRSGPVERLAPALEESSLTTKVLDYLVEEGQVRVDGAAVVVSGGRGVGGPEGFEPLRQLAAVLGGAVGASRAAVDAGWVTYMHQVGQTGKVVSPDLYIAAGISGAVQHQAGMRSSKVIVAINKDREAPIFNLAHYGVVGDLFEILPPLTEELKKRLGKG